MVLFYDYKFSKIGIQRNEILFFFCLKLKRLSVTAVNNNGDILILMVLMLLIHLI